MATFAPQGPFARSGNSGKKAFQAWPADHLVTVISVDPVGHKLTGRNQDGKEIIYQIEKAAFERGQAKSGYQNKRAGNRIDEIMAAEFQPGHVVIVEKAKVTPFKGDGGLQVYEANWIHNAPQQSPEKTFYGIFTAARKKGTQRLISVQRWDSKSSKLSDTEWLKSFVAKLEENVALKQQGVRFPYIGFQVRAMKPDGDGYVCFDSTLPYDGIKSDTGEFLPIGKDDFINLTKAYRTYLLESYPSFKEEGAFIEVMTYRSYKASERSDEMVWSSVYDKRNIMTERVSKASSDSEYFGRNIAVKGVMELTGDTEVASEMEFNGKMVKIMTPVKQDIVQRLHCNNSLFDVRSTVSSSDGKKVRLDESIFVNYKDQQPQKSVAETLQNFAQHIDPVGESVDHARSTTPWDDTVDEEDPFGLS